MTARELGESQGKASQESQLPFGGDHDSPEPHLPLRNLEQEENQVTEWDWSVLSLLRTHEDLRRESVDRLFEAQRHRVAEINSDEWQKQILESTGWSNLAEYLLASSGLLPEPSEQVLRVDLGLDPDIWPEDEQVGEQVRNRYRDQIKELVHHWRDNGLL